MDSDEIRKKEAALEAQQQELTALKSQHAALESNHAELEKHHNELKSKHAERGSEFALAENKEAKQDTKTAILKSGNAILESEAAIQDSEIAISKSKLAILKSEAAISKSKLAILKSEAAIQDSEIAILRRKASNDPSSLHYFATHFSGYRDETGSSAHTQPAHEVANVHTTDGLNLFEPDSDSLFWCHASGMSLFQHANAINGHGCVLIRVWNLIGSVVAALGLSEKMRVSVQRSMLSLQFDLMFVLNSTNLPIGSVEIKKPHSPSEDEKIFGRGKVAGKVYDQLQTIRLGGLRQAFALITTGNKWQLMSTAKLPDDDGSRLVELERSARSKNDTSSDAISRAQPVFHPENVMHGSTIISGSGKRELDEGSGVTEERCEEPRVLYASETIVGAEAGFDMIRLIATAILLIYESAKDLDSSSQLYSRKEILARKIQCHRGSPLDSTGRLGPSFRNLTVGTIDFHLNALTNDEVNGLYLIRPLGCGSHGSACLAIPQSGPGVCVVKFFNTAIPTQSKAFAKAELENWNAVYGDLFGQSFVTTASVGQHCLIIPYFWPVRQSDRARYTEKEEGALWDALCHFAEKGKRHMDVSWRHVGWHPASRRVALFDLGHVQDFDDAESSTDWVKRKFAELKEKAPSAP